eukprot:4240063-Pleurochrysis_carterae.AAC.4
MFRLPAEAYVFWSKQEAREAQVGNEVLVGRAPQREVKRHVDEDGGQACRLRRKVLKAQGSKHCCAGCENLLQ